MIFTPYALAISSYLTSWFILFTFFYFSFSFLWIYFYRFLWILCNLDTCSPSPVFAICWHFWEFIGCKLLLEISLFSLTELFELRYSFESVSWIGSRIFGKSTLIGFVYSDEIVCWIFIDISFSISFSRLILSYLSFILWILWLFF